MQDDPSKDVIGVPLLEGEDILRAFEAMEATFSQFQTVGKAVERSANLARVPRIVELVAQAQAAENRNRRLAGFTTLAAALSNATAGYNDGLRLSVAAMRVPVLSPQTLSALQDMQRTVGGASASVAAHLVGLGLSIKAAQEALSDAIPAGAVRSLQDFQDQIAQTAVEISSSGRLPAIVNRPGASLDAQQAASEEGVALVLSNVVAQVARQRSEDVNVEWVVQYSFLVLVAAGVTSATVISSFLSSIAAGLLLLLLQNRSSAASTDRIVEAINSLDQRRSEKHNDPSSSHPETTAR